MTIEQLNYLLRNELYAIKNHKDNIDRIKKEYFDSNYGLKEGEEQRTDLIKSLRLQILELENLKFECDD